MFNVQEITYVEVQYRHMKFPKPVTALRDCCPSKDVCQQMPTFCSKWVVNASHHPVLNSFFLGPACWSLFVGYSALTTLIGW